MKTASAVLSVLGTLLFFGALVIACLPSAVVTRLTKRLFNRDRPKPR